MELTSNVHLASRVSSKLSSKQNHFGGFVVVGSEVGLRAGWWCDCGFAWAAWAWEGRMEGQGVGPGGDVSQDGSPAAG